eukprot:g17014.t1
MEMDLAAVLAAEWRALVRHKEAGKVPSLQVEHFRNKIYLHAPVLFLGVPSADLQKMCRLDCIAGESDKRDQYRMKGELVERILSLHEVDLLAIEQVMIIRSLHTSTKLVGGLTPAQKEKCADMVLPQGADLLTVRAFLILCRDKVQGMIKGKRKYEVVEQTASALSYLICGVLYAPEYMDADDLLFEEGITFADEVTKDTVRALHLNQQWSGKALQRTTLQLWACAPIGKHSSKRESLPMGAGLGSEASATVMGAAGVVARLQPSRRSRAEYATKASGEISPKTHPG